MLVFVFVVVCFFSPAFTLSYLKQVGINVLFLGKAQACQVFFLSKDSFCCQDGCHMYKTAQNVKCLC